MASVTKRGNAYTIRTSLGYNSAGKQIQKFTTWKPAPGMTEKQIEKELERQKVLFEEKCKSGKVLDGSTKFFDFSEYWLAEHAEKQLRPTTVAGYRLMLRRILPAIGHIRLDRLQPHHLMELYANLQEGNIRADKKMKPVVDVAQLLKERKTSKTALSEKAGVSIKVIYALTGGGNVTEESAQNVSVALDIPLKKLFAVVPGEEKPLAAKTVLHHHRLVSSILDKAVKWQVIFSNPCDRVEPPKVERKEAKSLDEKQVAALLERLEREPLQYRAMIKLFLYTGMRRGELCGLAWSDVDFDGCLIDINKSSLYLSDRGIFEDKTKNFSSQRVIKVPPEVMELLSVYKRTQTEALFRLGDKWDKTGKVFAQSDGKPIHPDSITGWFRKFVKRNNLPPVSIHSLRHTNASLLIAAGTDLRTVSKRLGHSTMTTTGNIYVHAVQTADERAAEALSDILNPAQKKNA